MEGRKRERVRRPRGPASGFIGVQRAGKKWAAGITYRGEHYYLGVFDDRVAAAKARDRKAYELHGEHAFLNFPEDAAYYRKVFSRKGTRPRRKAR